LDILAKAFETIWNIVDQIPFGKVATYGQIAKISGLTISPKIVGYALRSVPENRSLAWHRVINSKGQISFPEGTDKFFIQLELLRSENILLIKNKIDLERYLHDFS
jgi:methylated-DNA-protein-cysteine methyltransferase-like protein